MNLAHRLNTARNTFLAYARRNPCKAVKAMELADGIESAIEQLHEQGKRITLLEQHMRTADQAVKDLLTIDAAKDATITDLKTKLADAETRAIRPDTLAAVNVAAPEPATPSPDAPPQV